MQVASLIPRACTTEPTVYYSTAWQNLVRGGVEWGTPLRRQMTHGITRQRRIELVPALARHHLASLHRISHPRRAHPQTSGQIRERHPQLPHRPKAKETLCLNPSLAPTPSEYLLSIDFEDLGNPLCNSLEIMATPSQLRLPGNLFLRLQKNRFDKLRVPQDPLIALEMIPSLRPQSLYRRPAAKTPNQPAPTEILTTALLYPRLHVSTILPPAAPDGSAKGAKNVVHILPGSLLLAHDRAMPTVWVAVQSRKVRDDSRPQRIQVKVTNQLLEVCVLLANDGFVAVLEKMAVASVPAVEADHIAGQQPSHHRSDGNLVGAHKKVGVVWQECPGIAGGFRLQKKISQTLEKILSVLGISEDLSALDPPDHDMVKNTGSIKAS